MSDGHAFSNIPQPLADMACLNCESLLFLCLVVNETNAVCVMVRGVMLVDFGK